MVRIKERYLLVNIIYPPDTSKPAKSGVPRHVIHHQPTTEDLTFKTLQKAVKKEISLLFGDYGTGALSNLKVKYLSVATSTFILQCHRAHYQMLWSALTFMKHIPTTRGEGKPCIFRVVRVSGTLRKAEEEAIRQARRLIIAAKEEADSATSGFASLPPVAEPRNVLMDVEDEDEDDSSDESMADADG